MENGRLKVWLPAIKSGSGVDIYTRNLAAGLRRHGVEATITWFPLSREILPPLLQLANPPLGTDIILANSWIAFAFRRYELPLIAVVHHCSFEPELKPYKGLLQSIYHRLIVEGREQRSLHAADAVVAVSHYVEGCLRKKHHLDRVEVIYNWVDTDLFSPQLSGLNENRPFRLLFVGKPTLLKGGDMLAPLMRTLGDGFEVRVTADRSDIRGDSIPRNLLPIGRLSHHKMVKAYQECDAVLIPSRSEGFGYVALEAMACSKPVIAGNNSALPELVAHLVTGIVCNTAQVDDFENACRMLAHRPDLALAMGTSGRTLAAEEFSEAKALERYVSLLECLL